MPSRSSASTTERGTALANSPGAVDRADIRPLDLPGALQILIAEVRASLIEALAAELQPADSLGSPGSPYVAPQAAGIPESVAEVRASLIGTVAADLQASAVGAGSLPGTIADDPDGPSLAKAEMLAVAATQDLDGPVPAARAVVDLVLRSLPQTFEPESWSATLPRIDQAAQAGVQRAIDTVSLWRDVPAVVVEVARESGNLALALLADEPVYPWPPPEWVGMAPRLALLWRRRRVLKRRLVDPDYTGRGLWEDPEDPQR